MSNLKKGKNIGQGENKTEDVLQNLANNLILHERIKTTETKAKELQPFVERLVTRGKKQDTNSLRKLIQEIPKDAAYKMYHEIAPKYEDREGGYTRVIKHTKRRKQDGAKMASIEFV